jgi:NADH-quinone oxidoreductase subunit A
MNFWLLLPPFAFSLILFVVLLFSYYMKKGSFRGAMGPGAKEPYSCGEEMEENKYQPNYGQFFSFAFFFTIMHVVALVVATIPVGVPDHFFMAALYLAGVLISLFSLIREDR